MICMEVDFKYNLKNHGIIFLNILDLLFYFFSSVFSWFFVKIEMVFWLINVDALSLLSDQHEIIIDS